MADIIQLLPESIANQIAAGEVIQRPASVIKELLENSIDAGSTEIEIILKDSGKSLIQIVDNGKGMSETDARMAFERHATSKIRVAADLFKINTMGFRGEALASIASIAHVELKTRTEEKEVGTRIVINGSNSIAVKNLFFNVPARRNFLKTDATELSKILEEFKRIALIKPEIFFKVHHNGVELYYLPSSNIRQRVVSIFGKKYNEKLLPVQEETDAFSVQGFVGQVDAAKKTRGEQYLFVNERYIKSNYLNHAIRLAYGDLLTKDVHPFYVLNLSIDPAQIDINVHPTKHEIKFQEERIVYNFLNVAIKHALGKYSLRPMIDFEAERQFENVQSSIGQGSGNMAFQRTGKQEIDKWSSLYDEIKENQLAVTDNTIYTSAATEDTALDPALEKIRSRPFQIHNKYIVHQIKSGFVLIHQTYAHERIQYERFKNCLSEGQGNSQKLLFPITINYSPERFTLIKHMLDELNHLGYEIENFGDNSIIVHASPAELEEDSVEDVLDRFLKSYEENIEFQLGVAENLARSLAKSTALKRGTRLTEEEMQAIIDKLFACQNPYINPEGKKSIISYEISEIENLFK